MPQISYREELTKMLLSRIEQDAERLKDLVLGAHADDDEEKRTNLLNKIKTS